MSIFNFMAITQQNSMVMYCMFLRFKRLRCLVLSFLTLLIKNVIHFRLHLHTIVNYHMHCYTLAEVALGTTLDICHPSLFMRWLPLKKIVKIRSDMCENQSQLETFCNVNNMQFKMKVGIFTIIAKNVRAYTYISPGLT